METIAVLRHQVHRFIYMAVIDSPRTPNIQMLFIDVQVRVDSHIPGIRILAHNDVDAVVPRHLQPLNHSQWIARCFNGYIRATLVGEPPDLCNTVPG